MASKQQTGTQQFQALVDELSSDGTLQAERAKIGFAAELCRLMGKGGITPAALARRVGRPQAWVDRVLRADAPLTSNERAQLALAASGRIEMIAVGGRGGGDAA